MDEETKKFIEDSISGLKGEINTTLSSIVTSMKTVATEVQTIKTKVETPSDTSTPPANATSDDASKKLEEEMATLRQQLADQQEATKRSEFTASLNSMIAETKDLRSPSIVKDLLLSRWSNKIEKQGDQFVIKFSDTESKALKDAYKEFLGTDDGKALLAAQRPRGTDPTPPKTSSTNTSQSPGENGKEKEVTSLDLFAEMYQKDQQKKQAAFV